MTAPEVIFIGIAVWMMLIALKAIARVGDGKSYVLTSWDAMHRSDAGRILGPRAMYMRIVLGLAAGPVAFAYFRGALMGRTSAYAIGAIMLGMSVSTLGAEEPPR